MTDNETRGRFAAAMSSGANLDAVIAVHEARVAELQGDIELLTGRAEAAEDAENRLRAVIANVRVFHVSCSQHATCADDDDFCHECGHVWPCSTALALAPAAEEPTTDQPEDGA